MKIKAFFIITPVVFLLAACTTTLERPSTSATPSMKKGYAPPSAGHDPRTEMAAEHGPATGTSSDQTPDTPPNP